MSGPIAAATSADETRSVAEQVNVTGLPAGQTVSVRIGYRSTLRSDVVGSNWLFTRANGVVDAYRWLPWISRPIAFDRPNHGDPFETPVSPRVRVRIVSDRVLRYATTGEQVADSGLTKVFEATDVRDFAFTAAPSTVARVRVIRPRRAATVFSSRRSIDVPDVFVTAIVESTRKARVPKSSRTVAS